MLPVSVAKVVQKVCKCSNLVRVVLEDLATVQALKNSAVKCPIMNLFLFQVRCNKKSFDGMLL